MSAAVRLEAHVEHERIYAATVVAMPELCEQHRVAPEDLSTPEYSRVVEAVLRLRLGGSRVTRVALRAELERMGFDRMTKGEWLDELGDIEPDIEPIAQRLREIATARRMHGDASRLVAMLARGDVAGAREVIGRLQLAHDPSSNADPVMGYRELLTTSLEAIIAERGALAKLISVGMPSVDRNYKLAPGSMLVVGAQTNVGKSSLLITWLHDICGRNIPAGLISVEDPSEDWGAKLIGALTGINPSRLWAGQVRPDDQDKLGRIQQAQNLPMSFCYVSDRSLDGVLSRMEFMVRVRGARVIMVDYLQAIAHRDAPSMRERIDRTLEELIAQAGRLGVALVLASQLARPEKGNPFREPNLIDLKESGSIENRAQCVVMLWRRSDQPDAPVEAKIAKAKRQPMGARFTLGRDPKSAMLVEVT